MSPSAGRIKVAPLVRRLGREVLEAPDLDTLAHDLTRELARELALREVALLLWDRKLDRFEAVSSAWAGRRPVTGPQDAPATAFLLVEGQLVATPSHDGDGVLVPLMARSGLVGMLVLGAPVTSRRQPFPASEARLVSDLAGRLALAVENHLYKKELIASERLAALGTMAGMMAHDFRGPMTVIRGYAELIAQDDAATGGIRAHADTIVEMVDRLERMTHETLDLVRAGNLARRAVPGEALVAELAAALTAELPSVEVRTRLDLPAGTHVSTDVDKLRRVVSNLGANARDAMGGGGRLHLEARLADGHADGVPRFELVISDEGPGVPVELRARVFEPFVTHGKKGGTGLGLAVARRFVEDHGGALELLDRAPGAHFRIALPLSPAP